MKRPMIVAMITLLLAGCTSAKPAAVPKLANAAPPAATATSTAPEPQPGPGAAPTQPPQSAPAQPGPATPAPDAKTAPAPAPAPSEGIRIIREGKALPSTARMLNGTLYLALPAGDPAAMQAPVRDGRIELGPGTGFDIPGSRLYMRAGEQLIVPPLVAEGGVVWAPASYYRTNGWRLQYDPQAQTVTMTSAWSGHPFPEEIPAEVTGFLGGTGPAPRVRIFRNGEGLTFVALATAGSNLRLIDQGSNDSSDAGRVFIAKTGEAGATDRVVRMLAPVPLPVGIQVWLQPDGQGTDGKPPARFFVGESQDAVLSREESEGRISPAVDRTTPTAVVLHYSSQLGVEPGDVVAEEINGDAASVKITKLGQVFYASLRRGKLGWQLVATTWGVPCEAADYCAQAMKKGVR